MDFPLDLTQSSSDDDDSSSSFVESKSSNELLGSPSPSADSSSWSPDVARHADLPCWHAERCNGTANDLTPIMDDRTGTGDFECAECGLRWGYRHLLVAHLRSPEHRRRVDFMEGELMLYCMICNRLPLVSAELHALCSEHTTGLAALARGPLVTDCTVRRVVVCSDGRRRAVWYPSGLDHGHGDF
jgi:hypothetical protein